MDFEALVKTRRSVRGFKAEPVPRAVIEEIIAIAKRAPSSMNTQPWHVHVLTGEPLERVRQRNMDEMLAGAKPKRDIISHGEYQGVHRKRQVDIAKKLFAVMGIERDDKPMRQDWVMRGFRQFDAPVSLVLSYDRVLDPGAVCHFDLGALCYGIVLAAWDRGLGSVINGQGIMRSDIVREVADPESGHNDLRRRRISRRACGHAVTQPRSNDDFVRYVNSPTSLIDRARHAQKSTETRPAAAHRCAVQCVAGKPRQEARKRDRAFEPRQRHPGALMRAGTKRKVPVRRAADIESFRIYKLLGVAVGRADAQRDWRAGR